MRVSLMPSATLSRESSGRPVANGRVSLAPMGGLWLSHRVLSRVSCNNSLISGIQSGLSGDKPLALRPLTPPSPAAEMKNSRHDLDPRLWAAPPLLRPPCFRRSAGSSSSVPSGCTHSMTTYYQIWYEVEDEKRKAPPDLRHLTAAGSPHRPFSSWRATAAARRSTTRRRTGAARLASYVLP